MDRVSRKATYGEDFKVEVISPLAVRYWKGERSITLVCELVACGKHDKKVRSVFWEVLFTRTCLQVFVEEPLRWDNEDDPIPPEETAEIIGRVEQVLRQTRGGWRIVRGPQSQQAV